MSAKPYSKSLGKLVIQRLLPTPGKTSSNLRVFSMFPNPYDSCVIVPQRDILPLLMPLVSNLSSVGCVLTNDRLASTGWVESSDCRFCHVSKESLPNLLQCDKLHEQIGRPIPHEFGPNFLTMGHVHHPLFVARRRLLHLTANELEVSPQFCDGEPRRLWSDGSVVHADRFWLATATYAIVDSNGSL